MQYEQCMRNASTFEFFQRQNPINLNSLHIYAMEKLKDSHLLSLDNFEKQIRVPVI